MDEGDKPTDFWDRDGVRWIFDGDTQLWRSEDVSDEHEPVTSPGAIDEDRQPTYGHPPNNAQQIAADIEEELNQ